MKKIFRMSMVLALAASALVYTGCTKDYSEQLSKIDSTLTDLGKKHDIDIANLDAAIKSLESAKADKSALEAAVKDANDKIEALKKQAADDLAKLRADHNADVQSLVAKITAAETRIAELEKLVARVNALEAKAAALEQSIADLKDAHDKDILAVKTALQTAYAELKGMIDAEKTAREAADEKLAKDLAAEQARAEAAEKALAADIQKIFGDIEIINDNIDSLFKAVAATDAKLDEEIEARKKEDAKLLELIEACYTKTEVDAIVAGLQKQIDANEAAIKDLQAKKLDIAAFEEWLAETYAKDKIAVNAKIDAEILRATTKEGEIEAALEAYKEDMEDVVALIYKTINSVNENLQAWCQANEDALNAYKEEMEGKVALIYSTINDVQTTLGAWIESVETDLNEHKAAYAVKVAEIEKAIADANDAIEALQGRVQAISFVPEYVKGSAPVALAYVPMNGTKRIADKAAVHASFQVKPASKAATVKAAIEAGEAKVVYVNVGTKFANNAKEAEVYYTSLSNDNVDLGITVPYTGNNLAIAVVYTSKDGNEVVSDYAPIYVEQWTPAYALIKGSDKYVAKPVEEAWVDAPAKHTWYEGYTLKVTSPWVGAGSFFAIDDIAKMWGLNASALTPSYSVTYKATDKNGASETAAKALNYPKNGALAYASDFTEMKGQEIARQNIGEKVEGTGVFTLEAPAGNKVNVLTYVNSYKIIKRQIDVKVEDYSITWNYKNIDALSSAHKSANYLDKAIDKTFDKNLREMVVTIDDQFKAMDLDNIVKGGATKTTVDGAAAPAGFKFDVDAQAFIKAQLAEVSLKGYKSLFGTADKKHEIVNNYEVSSMADAIKDTDVNLIWNVTFTAKDTDATVDLGALGLFDYKLDNIVLNIDLAKTRDAMFAKVVKLDTDKATWWAQLGGTNEVKYQFQSFRRPKGAISATEILNTTSATPTGSYMKIYSTSQVILKEADIMAMSDTFGFSSSYTTWYGVKYNWFSDSTNANNGLKPLSFKLAYWPELSKVATADDYNGKLTGKRIAEVAYNHDYNFISLEDDNLSRYFMVEGLKDMTAAQIAKLKVTYTRTTPETPIDGYDDAPVIGSTDFTLAAKIARAVSGETGKISDAPVDWFHYDARDLGVKATLSITAAGHDIAMDDNLEITLVAEDVLKFAADKADLDLERVDISTATIDLKTNLSVYPIYRNAPKKDIDLYTNGTWERIAGAGSRRANEFYGISNPTFKIEGAFVGAKDGQYTEYPTTTLWIDSNNRLNYQLDAAKLQEPVYVHVSAQFGTGEPHYYSWFMGQMCTNNTVDFWVKIYQK